MDMNGNTSKYQKALNWFQEQICAEKSDFCKKNKCCPKECSECDENRYYKILQELIDNYSKIEAERNYYIMDNASVIEKYESLKKAYENLSNNLESQIEELQDKLHETSQMYASRIEYSMKLEKALDIACKELETHNIAHYDHDFNENVEIYSYKDWKKYLLQESEEK